MPDDLQKLRDDFRDLGKRLVDQKLLNKIGLAGIRRIKDRTRRGVDYLGLSFKAYSEGHAKKRRKLGLPTGHVDLVFSLYDGMMQQLDHMVFRDLSGLSILIDDNEKQQLAVWHNIEGAGRSRVKREFFNLSDADVDEIDTLVGVHIDGLLESLSLN